MAIDRAGNSYENGLVTAGDWLYIGDWDATHYKQVPRRKWTDDSEELLDFTSNKLAGSADCDRNGYRYALFYDEVNDRVFYQSFYNGNMIVVLDASTATPDLLWCDIADAGGGDDAYERGLHIPDPVSAPNVMVVGASSQLVHIDITPCLTGSAPTLLGRFYTEQGTDIPNAYACQFRVGTKYQSTTNAVRDRPNSGICTVSPDRNRVELFGWLDFDNYRIVAPYRYVNINEDTTTDGRGRSLRINYGAAPFRMQSEDGTSHWVMVGYGMDGHQFTTWPDSVVPELYDSWEVEWGTYTPSTGSIEFVYIKTAELYTPSGCTLNKYVSNDNGASWETYNEGASGFHIFTSTGTQLRVKYTASGTTAKMPYKSSLVLDQVVYGSLYEAATSPGVPFRIRRSRLAGKK